MSDQQLKDSTPLDPSTWIENYGDQLYRYALSRLRDPDSAEEVVQETIVSALKNADQYAGKGSERAWLIGILKLKVIDFYRSRNRNPVNLDEESGGVSEKLFDQNGSWRKEIRQIIRNQLDSIDREEFWEALKTCLGRLPDRHSAVFTLRTVEEQPAEEICKDLGISSTNYWVILHRARLQLASCMKRRWFNEVGQ